MKRKNRFIGLTETEVQQSREKHGSNLLTPPKKEPLWRKFLDKFRDPLIIVLLIAGALSFLISIYEFSNGSKDSSVFFEPLGIFIAIFLATGLAFYFELRADKEFEILNRVNDDELVKVIRDSSTIEISKRNVVVGDLVVIGSGDEIPADGELLESVMLHVDESSLTGEPICEKTTEKERFDSEATFASNAVMRGTKVMEGHAIFKVFAVGDATENGKVFEAAQIDNSVKTPLNEQLEALGKLITKISYLIASLIVVSRIFFYFHSGTTFELVDFISHLLHTAMIAVTLIVVAVPEGLPMAVTLSLAYSMRRMLKTNNLVRKMHACETMGATTVICTDKTGTLTQNQMSIYKTNFYELKDQKLADSTISSLIKEGVALNSTATLDYSDPDRIKVLGNPTEGALLLWLKSCGVDFETIKEQCKKIEELPFSTERKYMATVVKSSLLEGKKILYVKGAPEIVYSLSKTTSNNVDKNQIDSELTRYQNQAMRTLGFAYQILDDNTLAIENGRVVASNLTFLGIVAISDPVRKEVPEAIKESLAAGINIKIVTGDTSATAKEIGRQIGLWRDCDSEKNIITGTEFAKLTDKELYERVLDLKIISRARPMDKKRLVESLQNRGEVVAVTGDGTNDAPALKAAHVGLSMGDGTSVAKEASDITIIDNSFNSITRAVMWGRSLYQNIQRFILFQVTINVTACLIVLVGAFMGSESPLTVTQMLWVNLIMDTFAAMSLASLPPTNSVMKCKPRDRSQFIINRPMKWSIVVVGGLFFTLLTTILFMFNHTEITALSDLTSAKLDLTTSHLSSYELSLFFTIFVMLQFWNMFNAKAFETKRSALHFKGCSGFISIALMIVIGQIFIVSLGGEMFNVTPLNIKDWITIIIATSSVLWIGEIIRLLLKRTKVL